MGRLILSCCWICLGYQAQEIFTHLFVTDEASMQLEDDNEVEPCRKY